jgi:alpha-L-fucosidase 2
MRNYLINLLLVLPAIIQAQHKNNIFEVDDSYLLKHDIVYKTPAFEGYEGFPLGNGDLGGMFWNNKNGLEIQINKNDLFDQPNQEAGATLRNGARLSIDLGAPGFEWLFLDDFDGRLSLKNAEVSIRSVTPFVTNEIKSWVSANKNVWFVQIKTNNTNKENSGSKIRVSLERYGSRAFPGWYGGYTKNTQIGLGNTKAKTVANDIILEEKFDGLNFSVACRILGEETTAELISNHRAELKTEQKSNHSITVMVSVVTSNEANNTTQKAIELLNEVENEGPEKQKEIHQAWWSDFWGKSFICLGHDYIENLYYLRRYLMGSSSRGRFPVVFNGGLWTWNHDVRNWVTPHHWNTQQQYWGLAAQNDCDLMLPYLNTYFRLMPEAEKHAEKRGAKNAILWSEPHDFFGSMTFWNRGDMLNNFTPASQIAGFFWEYYQFTNDKKFLSGKAYPFLKKAAEFYVQTLKWDKEKN